MADEGVDHGHNRTSESTFEGAPSASGLHASPSPTTTTLPTPDPAAATSTPITTPPMAENTGFTGMPTYPAYHSVEITIKLSGSKRQTVSAYRHQPRAVHPVRQDLSCISKKGEYGHKEGGHRREEGA